MRTKHKKTAFTIVELLTVMSIIVILISLLLPALNAAKRFSRKLLQKNQFRNIGSGLQIYESDFDEYPNSYAKDADGKPYCGAMKLAEVMAGQDGLGFHLDSRLTNDGQDADGTALYLPGAIIDDENLWSRKEYLERIDIRICSLDDLYESPGTTFSRTGDIALLCDVFLSVKSQATGGRMGMPVLYYRADTSKLLHDPCSPDMSTYDYTDNYTLLDMGLPWETDTEHPLSAKEEFYKNTLDKDLPISRPHNKDSYILISAGWDGIYGTRDDVYNFKN